MDDKPEWKKMMEVSEKRNKRLLPCPFCGSLPHLGLRDCDNSNNQYAQVECFGCETTSGLYTRWQLHPTEEEKIEHIEAAISSWNFRTP